MLFFDTVRDAVTYYGWWTKGASIIVAYLTVLIGTYSAAQWIGGYKWSDRVTNFLGFPVAILAWVLKTLWLGLTWPHRYRTHRLFKETFEISWETEDDAAQKAVNSKLGYFSRNSSGTSGTYWQDKLAEGIEIARKRNLRTDRYS